MNYIGIILIVLGILSVIFAILATPADRAYSDESIKLGKRFFKFTFDFRLMTLFILIGIALITIGILLLL